MFFFLLLPRSPLSSRESQEILGLSAHRGRNGVRHTPAVAPKPLVLLQAPPAHLSHPHINSELPPPPIPRTSRTGASTATSTWRRQCCTAFAGCCCCCSRCCWCARVSSTTWTTHTLAGLLQHTCVCASAFLTIMFHTHKNAAPPPPDSRTVPSLPPFTVRIRGGTHGFLKAQLTLNVQPV